LPSNENRIELMKYRIESAKSRLRAAKVLFEAEEYKDSINRSYYAMFTAVRGLLALDAKDFSKHAGVIAYFQREYIKTGKIDKKYSKYVTNAFQIRNSADYTDFYIVSAEDARIQIQNAEELLAIIDEYINNIV